MNPHLKPITWKSKKYLDHVRKFPCAVCGFTDTQAHHIRFSYNSGMGKKPGDIWAIPLCHTHHREYHDMGITSFQKKYEVNIYQQLFFIAKNWIENQ
ncbi:MAG: DUF968 domain-containing protein [Desulfobacula sp.]|jgi:hypothetical protein|uniref:DUF968 domain-containing protein n=1 Tax=Desulfobacula sp. TaxID=2593537 RepID=UPI0039B9268C|nr:DUF968 domain-containing protein [Desulfobacula sp.]